MLATSDFRDGNAVIGKVRRCLTPETSVNSHGKLVLHPLRNVKLVQCRVLFWLRWFEHEAEVILYVILSACHNYIAYNLHVALVALFELSFGRR